MPEPVTFQAKDYRGNLRAAIRDARARIAPRRSEPLEAIVKAVAELIEDLDEKMQLMDEAVGQARWQAEEDASALANLLEAVADWRRGILNEEELWAKAQECNGPLGLAMPTMPPP